MLWCTASGFGHVVEVVQSKVEQLQLPEKVDVLVSEPMGTLLINERMLETYIYARDHFLKPGGKMFPVSRYTHTHHTSACTPLLQPDCRKVFQSNSAARMQNVCTVIACWSHAQHLPLVALHASVQC